MRVFFIGLMKAGGIDDLLLYSFCKQRAQLGIYILRAVIQVLNAEGFYFQRDGSGVLKGILAGGVGEYRSAGE